MEKVGEKAKRAVSKTNLNDDSGAKQTGGGGGALPNKMSFKDFGAAGDAASTGGGDTYPGVTTKYVDSSFRRVGSGSSRKNRDPGVQSDDEDQLDDDDMLKFEALSHKSSGSSLNVGGGGGNNNLGIVSKTSTPMSGSLEKIPEGQQAGDMLLRRSFGTPLNPRKDVTPTSTPRSSRYMQLYCKILCAVSI